MGACDPAGECRAAVTDAVACEEEERRVEGSRGGCVGDGGTLKIAARAEPNIQLLHPALLVDGGSQGQLQLRAGYHVHRCDVKQSKETRASSGHGYFAEIRLC